MSFLTPYKNFLNKTIPYKFLGNIKRVVGITIESEGPIASVGELCLIKDNNGHVISKGEVVGFKDDVTYIMPFDYLDGIKPGYIVEATNEILHVKVGEFLKGRILNGIGELIDGTQISREYTTYPINNKAPDPLKRKRIEEPITTGIKAIDGLLTIGLGQRMGIFAGSGVGKSVLLGMIAKYSSADVNVIALIGERGREVREFLERDLGEEGLAKSVVVVATSDQPSLVRLKAPFVACAIAEYFRDLGLNVMLMMDSITRIALAQREIGLAIGEPPTTRGYPPSVFTLMPKILERAGRNEKGSITGLYTVLVEGGDLDEPVSDTVRGILDGHIILSRDLANRNHFPAIDVLGSISRVMDDIISLEHSVAVKKLKNLLAIYNDAKDLIDIGAYNKGSNPKIDLALNLLDEIENFLKQDRREYFSFNDTLQQLNIIAEKITL